MNRLGPKKDKRKDEKIIKNIRNLFKLKTVNQGIKGKNLFHQEKEHYYKPVRVGNLQNNNQIEYESNGDRNS